MPHFTSAIAPDALQELLALRKTFIEDRMIFVKSEQMISLLTALGARGDDFNTIQQTSGDLKDDPTLPFRRSKNGRFCVDLIHKTVERLEFQPFILSASEDFVRHDSGKVRRFDQIDDDLQGNTVLKALFVFKAFMFAGVQTKHRDLLDYEQTNLDGSQRDQFICTLFHLRTVTQKGLIGEPAKEGVHSDGVDFTMTTYLGSTNMTMDSSRQSAVTFLHTLNEKTGIPYQNMNPKHLLGSVQHREFLDTLLIADHERKHSLSPVWQVDESQPAMRDMLIFFTRRPVVEGHHSSSFDSTKAHETMPMKWELLDFQDV